MWSKSLMRPDEVMMPEPALSIQARDSQKRRRIESSHFGTMNAKPVLEKNGARDEPRSLCLAERVVLLLRGREHR
jgi:hypothetical protein